MLGEFLKKERLKRNLNQKKFAELLDMKQCYYSLIENNKRRPSFSTIDKIANFFKVRPSYIVRLLNDNNQ